jgi:hypothetical protein
VVVARLECDIEARTAASFAGDGKGFDLGMGAAGFGVEAFSNDDALANDYSADGRIR